MIVVTAEDEITMIQLNPYLSFNGQCEAAFRFYERCLGGKIECIMTYESKPAEFPVPAEWRNTMASHFAAGFASE